MKSHAELTKRQLQVLPHFLACHAYEEAVNKLKYNTTNNTTKAADTLVTFLSHSNPTIQRGVANDLLNHVIKEVCKNKLHDLRCDSVVPFRVKRISVNV